MHLHLSNHISVAYFKNELIVLDLKQDKYFILDENKTQLLVHILGQHWKRDEEGQFVLDQKTSNEVSPDLCHDFAKTLVKNEFIQNELYADPYPPIKKNQAAGVEQIDWRLPIDETFKTPLSFSVLKAFYTLLKVHMTVKFKGFYSLIHGIRKGRKATATYKAPSAQELNLLVNTLNKACLLYPIRTKCLEWAATLILLSLKKGWKCSLNVGVQNYPFLAHAWADVDGKVIADDPTLPENMAVILSTPFNEETKKC